MIFQTLLWVKPKGGCEADSNIGMKGRSWLSHLLAHEISPNGGADIIRAGLMWISLMQKEQNFKRDCW